METQYLGPSKVKGVENSSSEQEVEKQEQDQARKVFILVAQKAETFYGKYVKNYEYLTAEMPSLTKDDKVSL